VYLTTKIKRRRKIGYQRGEKKSYRSGENQNCAWETKKWRRKGPRLERGHPWGKKKKIKKENASALERRGSELRKILEIQTVRGRNISDLEVRKEKAG